MKKTLIMALTASMILSTTVLPSFAENTTTAAATATATPAATVEATASPEASATAAATASPEASATAEATTSPEASATAAATTSPEATATATATPAAAIVTSGPVAILNSSYVGKVTSVEEGYVNIELADGTKSVTTDNGTATADEYVILSYSADGDTLSKISSWFYNEFAQTQIGFGLVNKTDYTAPATRLDFAETIYSYLESKSLITTAADSVNKFTDVDSNAVTALNIVGIINGVSDTEFDPTSPLTREAAATMLARTYFYANKDAQVSASAYIYNDADRISSWATESVYQLHELGMMQGDESSNFMPKSELTIEQALAVVLRSKLGEDATGPAATTATPVDDTQVANPIVKYPTLAEANNAVTNVSIGDPLVLADYASDYSVIDNSVVEAVYTKENSKITIRKALQTDASVTDISGVNGATTTGTVVITDTAKATGAESIEVALSTLGDSTVATFTLQDTEETTFNFSIVVEGTENVTDAYMQELAQSVIDNTPRG